jgi:uncharacterized protein (TIGR03067 family)
MSHTTSVDSNAPIYWRVKAAARWTAQIALAGAAVLIVSGAQAEDDELANEDKTRMTGKWALESVEYGGEKTDTREEKEIWDFGGDQVARYIGSTEVDLARLEIYPARNPKEIDFVPKETNQKSKDAIFHTRTKGLYSIENGRLKIALTYEFAPATAQQERQQSIENAKVRPKSFDTKRGDVVVFTFMRERHSKRE